MSVSQIEDAREVPARVSDARLRWVVVGQLWLHQVLALVAGSGLGILLIGMERDLQFGTTEAGWLGSARVVGQFVVFPLSFILVRFAAKSSYSAFLAAMTASVIASAVAPTYLLLLIFQIAFSTALAMSQIPAAMLRLQWVQPGEMARVWGIGNALSAVSQSITLAIVPFGVALLGGWRPIFMIVGGALFVAWLVWALLARERPSQTVRPNAARRDFSALRRREFYILGLTVLGGGTAYTTAIIFLPLYFVHERGFTLATAGSITAVLPAAGLISNLSAGFFSDRLGKRRMFIWPAGIVLPFLYFLALSPLPVPFETAVVFAVGYFAWFPFPILMAMPYELPGVRHTEVAVGQALVQAVSGAGILAGPIVTSYIAATTGSFRLGILALSLLPILFAVGAMLLPETGRKASVAGAGG